ncbi:MAG: alpha/beta hydrolase [Devosia sp.]|uniref:alpha/beta hydrolase family protein n=1 Tax=Devosia sp. TaxID=1871048 RepID=UPI0024C6DC59|nr:alpha/beta family hydrolase [Devosia sp.]UYO00020.1 MAG: alpha/beta hydrolase [Devosia sp.]
MALEFMIEGPEAAPFTLLLAHGAGAPMDSASMTATSAALAKAGIRVARFEFGYMAARREGTRKPPPKAEKVMPEFMAAVEALDMQGGALFIGGKSMGGRVASMVADALYADGTIKGLVCLGYPFHPPEKPENLRTAHLETLKTPTLIVQGTRDVFGTRAEVETYGLSPAITLKWLEDGDHDLKPRKTMSGFSTADHLRAMAEETAGWMRRVTAG